MRTFKNQMQAFAIKRLLKYVEKDPEVNAAKALKIIRKIDIDGTYGSAWEELERCLQDPQNNWTRLVVKAYTEWDAHVRRKLFETLICNAAIIGNAAIKKTSQKYGVNVPWTILMDPTSSCNLKCTGCWAAEYGHQMSMDFETLDRIVTEARALGVYMFIFSGGEPLVRKRDIIRLCEKHPDCFFLAFTNGTLIDEAFADEMLRVGNFAPAISVEGYEEETDMRRGKGTYKAVMRAMQILKEKRLLFGMSTCYHRKNVDVVGSSEYMDFMIDKGAAFVWYFTYMPVGNDAVPELMVTPEQRKFMYEQVRMFRRTKPIFAMDFWNDGEYVNGCIAGGRYYFHINANGDVEPCAFIHYSTVNIKKVSLLEALRSPLFKAYQQRQPFNKNHLRPCPLLDNPHSLKEVVHTSNAYSTDMMKPEDVDELTGKCCSTAEKWGKVADKIWYSKPENQTSQETIYSSNSNVASREIPINGESKRATEVNDVKAINNQQEQHGERFDRERRGVEREVAREEKERLGVEKEREREEQEKAEREKLEKAKTAKTVVKDVI